MCRVHGRGEWAYGEREDVPCPRGEGVKRIVCNLSKGGRAKGYVVWEEGNERLCTLLQGRGKEEGGKRIKELIAGINSDLDKSLMDSPDL